MGRYRIYLLVALVIASVTAATMLLSGAKRYYPLVRAHMPDNITLVFADTPWTDAEKCRAAERKMVEALRRNCRQCRIEDSCAMQIEPALEQALSGQAINNYVVHAGTMRIVVSAGDVSKQTCTAMAEQITHDNKQTAKCVSPQ